MTTMTSGIGAVIWNVESSFSAAVELEASETVSDLELCSVVNKIFMCLT